MSYTLEDEHGKVIHVFHTDRTVCDDEIDGERCPCKLPTSAQERARKRADSRGEWYVNAAHAKVQGPYTEDIARALAGSLLRSGYARVQMLRVVEDYGA